MNDIAKKLQAPFDACDIEWKSQTVGVSNGGKAYVLAVPYVTNRAIQKRLDDVFGVFGWENAYKPSNDGKGYICGITIHGERSVTKWDGAECTQIEPLKGGMSNSMKRAAVQLGIGRYLYDLPEFWATCDKVQGRFGHSYDNTSMAKKSKQAIGWNNPELPGWALPSIDADLYLDRIGKAAPLHDLKAAFAEAFNCAKVNQDKGAAEKFTAAYNQRKQELSDAAAQLAEQDTAEVLAWANNQARNFDMVPYAASVEAMRDSLLKSLAEMCEGKYVDAEEIKNQLVEAAARRIEAINNSEK